MNMEQTEGRIFSPLDRCELYWQCWRPRSTPLRAVVGVVHGFSEHSSRYQFLVDALLPHGFLIYAMDHRGHGRSKGARGHVDCFDQYRRDLHSWVQQVINVERGSLPLFLIGHSMGGLITLDYALHHPEQLAGIVVSGPMLRLRVQVPRIKAIAGKVFSKWLPRLTFPSGLDVHMLSHDPKVIKARQEDPWVHDVASARWFTEGMAAGQRVLCSASQLKIPALLMHGGDDPLTDPKATEEFYRAMVFQDKKWILWPGMFHEIFNEVEREKVFEAVRSWLFEHLQP